MAETYSAGRFFVKSQQSIILANFFFYSEKGFSSMYQLDYSSVELPPNLRKKVYFYRIDDKVLVDMTNHDVELQKLFQKPSEFRKIIWRKGVVERKKLVDTSRATLAARFLVKVEDDKSYWFYPHRMKKMPDMDD